MDMSMDELIAALAGYDSPEEYYESRPPYVARPQKHMTITVGCSDPDCSYEKTDDYTRQCPDKLILTQWCPECHKDARLVSVTPFTIFYWDYSLKHASFGDDVRGECWQCGYKKSTLQGYTLGNGERVDLCPHCFKHWHRTVAKYAQDRATWIEQRREERAGERGQWQKSLVADEQEFLW